MASQKVLNAILISFSNLIIHIEYTGLIAMLGIVAVV
jgi:hypothetical protein